MEQKSSSKTLRNILIAFIVVILMAGCFTGGLVAGAGLPNQLRNIPAFVNLFPNAGTAGQDNGTPEELQKTFQPFWQAWDLVHDQYVDQPVDDVALMQGAIRGMLDALGDEHTSYLDPVQYEQANTPLMGEYDGIGAWVDTSGDYLTIISPMEDSPAEAAGLKSDDKIIAVDGEDMTGTDPSLVLRRVLGPAGSSVSLTILREGEEPFDVTIVREKIVLHTVTSEMLDNNIAYVEIVSFGDKTTAELREALKELLSQKPVGLILDLRNNGGGFLDTAIEVSSEFIADGVIMYEEYGDGERITYEAKKGGLATEIPLVVLVNEGSASASEITAGAIQDLGRAPLVGVTTFGKGSVQTWAPLVDNMGAAKITIARWLTPNERQISKIGLTPDYVVELTEEDFEAERDPQLDKAIEILLTGK